MPLWNTHSSHRKNDVTKEKNRFSMKDLVGKGLFMTSLVKRCNITEVTTVKYVEGMPDIVYIQGE